MVEAFVALVPSSCRRPSNQQQRCRKVLELRRYQSVEVLRSKLHDCYPVINYDINYDINSVLHSYVYKHYDINNVIWIDDDCHEQ